MAEYLEAEKDEEIKEFISIIKVLPKEDRAVLLSNANALRVRSDIEKTKAQKERRWNMKEV